MLKQNKGRKKPSKKSTKSLHWYVKQTQTKFNALIREKGVCEHCGRSYDAMNCSHIYPVGAYPNLRFNVLNVLCLDARCHRFFWHDNPGDAWEWFKSKYPARYEYLTKAKNIFHKYTIEELLQIQGWVEKKEINKLTIPMPLDKL